MPTVCKFIWQDIEAAVVGCLFLVEPVDKHVVVQSLHGVEKVGRSDLGGKGGEAAEMCVTNQLAEAGWFRPISSL